MAKSAAETSSQVSQAEKTRVPFHPPLAHVAIGSYVTAAVCDTLSISGVAGSDGRALYQAATYALMIATAALIVAVITGFVDRGNNTSPGGRGRRMANLHALVMSALGVLAIVELILRRNVAANADAAQTPAVVYVLTLIVLVALIVGGRLGGMLVYRLGAGTSARSR